MNNTNISDVDDYLSMKYNLKNLITNNISGGAEKATDEVSKNNEPVKAGETAQNDTVIEAREAIRAHEAANESGKSMNIKGKSSGLTDLDYSMPSRLNLYKIPKGTELYHGSFNSDSFNPYAIRLGDESLISYFSPNERISASYFNSCAVFNEKKGGYLHKFKVKQDITQILVISQYTKKPHWDKKFLEERFCGSKFGIDINIDPLDGVAFFFSTDPNNPVNPKDINQFDVEFALCNPNKYLEYVSTRSCQGWHRLSDPYSFPL
jgi:hypothetical protein